MSTTSLLNSWRRTDLVWKVINLCSSLDPPCLAGCCLNVEGICPRSHGWSQSSVVAVGGPHTNKSSSKSWATSTGFISSVQFSSVAQSCATLCDPMNRSTPGLPVHHQLPEFTQIHAHRVGDATQPSHPLSSPSPPAPNPSQHQGLFQWVNSSHEAAKVLEFQLQHHSIEQITHLKSESESFNRSVISNSLWYHGLQPARFLCPWNSPGKNTGVSCYFLLQGIFPSHGSNLGLLLWRQILYCLSDQGSPSNTFILGQFNLECMDFW